MGGTLIFPYIRRLGPFLGVQNLEFQYIFFWGGGGLFRKMNIYFFYFLFLFGGGGGGGYEDWGSLQTGLVLRVTSMYFKVFS